MPPDAAPAAAPAQSPHNQAGPPQAPPNPEAHDYGGRIDSELASRTEALIEQLTNEQREEDRAASGAEDEEGLSAEEVEEITRKPAKEPKAAKVVEPPPVDAAAKERQERLDRVAEMERKGVRISAQLAEKEHALKAKTSDIEKREANLAKLEKVFDEPEALFSYLSDKVGAQKVADWLIAESDPAKKAESKVRTLEQQVEERLKKQEEALNARFAAIEEKEQEIARSTSRAKNEQAFATRLQQVAAEAPFTSRLLSRKPKEAMEMAHAAATQLLQNANGQEVTFDHVIRMLEDELSDLYGPQTTGSPDQSRQQHVSPSAAAQAPTLSNRAAGERSSVVNEEEVFARLPLKERTQRLERLARRG